jgi:hypothetical protein
MAPRKAKSRQPQSSGGQFLRDQIHQVRRSLEEVAFYPEHNQRTNSAKYSQIHKELVVNQNRPCLVCGVRNSILKDPKARPDPKRNPWGASKMETHHHVVEWALANAVDMAKFNQRIVDRLRRKEGTDSSYNQPFSTTEILDWIDHSPDNLWVLCDVHHRHKWVGIHAISGPIWGPQDIFKDNFAQEVRAALLANKAGAAIQQRSASPRRKAAGHR